MKTRHNISVNAELWAEARRKGLNISAFLEEKLKEEFNGEKSTSFDIKWQNALDHNVKQLEKNLGLTNRVSVETMFNIKEQYGLELYEVREYMDKKNYKTYQKGVTVRE